MPTAAPLAGQQLAAAGFAGVSPPQSHQPLHEADAGAAFPGLVILDGKKLRHGKGEIVNALNGKGQYLGGLLTPTKTNEIPVGRDLLRGLDLVGKLTVADAAHTQVETAQQILYEQGGDYLLTVKANQPTLHDTLQNLLQPQALSPSAHAADQSAAAGAQSGPAGNSFSPMPPWTRRARPIPNPNSTPRAFASASAPPGVAANASTRWSLPSIRLCLT